jgi:catechol 2,3-dioxygenase-like lactoylglutathione lyase family enzyme
VTLLERRPHGVTIILSFEGAGQSDERTNMLDHVFLTVSDMERSISFYEAALASLGINERFDFDGKNGPPGHPDLKGFGADGRLFLWLREGVADSRAVHVGFAANGRGQVDAAYAAAIAAGATDNGAPSVRLYYDSRYYAANVLDPDGYSIEFVYKSWQHS